MIIRLIRFAGTCALFVFGLLTIIATHGSGDSGPPNLAPSPPPDEAVGGLWNGLSDGREVFAMSTDSGVFRWIDWVSGDQGFGTASSDETTLTLSYTRVPALDSTLPDGSESATCSGMGTILGREELSIELPCTSNLDLEFTTSMSLVYDAEFERDSSLAAVSGLFDDNGVVMNVSSGGQLFEQDPFIGCVINGQIVVLDTNFNVYAVSLSYENCRGSSSVLNGSSFTGLATLSDSVSPEELLIAVTGEVDGVIVSRSFQMPRL